MDDAERLDRLKRAAKFYTQELGLALVKVHYPLYEPEHRPGDPDGTRRGRCSCNTDYVVEEQSDGTWLVSKGLSEDTNAGKHPRETGWSTDPAKQVTRDTDVDLSWGVPWNIGVPVGEAFDLAIIDVDTRNGGFATIQRLTTEAHYGFPRTFKDFSSGPSGNKGYHLFYRVRDEAVWNVLKEIKLPGNYGLDLKGIKDERGQVVVAPSMHATGTYYELDADQGYEIHELTFDEAKLFRDACEVIAPKREDGSRAATGRSEAVEQVKLWLAEGRVDTKWGPGNHNDNMHSAVGAIIGLVPPSQEVHIAWADRIAHGWCPSIYMLLVQEFDEAICEPRPYYESEGANILRWIREDLLKEMSKTTAAVEGVRAMANRPGHRREDWNRRYEAAQRSDKTSK